MHPKWLLPTSTLLLLPLLSPGSGHACGISTHVEVAHRAGFWFDGVTYQDYAGWVQANPEALQGGASFPDWGYALPNYGDAGEEAHWDPFLKQAADYVYRTYPPPWDRETQRLAVFLFAVSAHSVADMSWHGLGGIKEGFIDMLAAQDFNGDWDAAHTEADTGGDMVAAYELDQSYMKRDWYVPTDDMVAVYHELGYSTVDRQAITVANFLLFVGGHAEKLAGQLLYKPFASKSPMLTDFYQDYFVGGMDDMATFSAWKWAQMIDWMENGVAGSRFEVEPDPDHLQSQDYWIRHGLKLIDDGEMQVTMERTPRGVMFHASYPGLEAERAATPKAGKQGNLSARSKAARATAVAHTQARTGHAHARTSATLAARYQLATPYSHLGNSLARGDFNRDGRQDVAMGAPSFGGPGQAQFGLVGVQYGRSTLPAGTLDLKTKADVVLQQSDEYARFGWGLAVVDFNADGIDDLAVSAPTTEARGLHYYGEVRIFFGSSTGLHTSPDAIIDTLSDYTVLGQTIGAGDANGDGFVDLLVGSPHARRGGVQRGVAAVFLSRKAQVAGTLLDLEDADWIQSGEVNYDWFGTRLGIARLASGVRMLLVGASGVNADGLQSVGRLYGYAMTGIDTGTASLLPTFTLTGTTEFQQLGLNFAAGDPFNTGYPVVALSSPTWGEGTLTQAGEVSLYRVADLVGDLYTDSTAPITSLRGSEDYARFGWSVAFEDVDGDKKEELWIGVPFSRGTTGAEEGDIYAWSGASIPVGTVRDAPTTATVDLSGQEVAARFGTTFLLTDLNGDGQKELLASARQSSLGATLAGEVQLLTSPLTAAARISSSAGMASQPRSPRR